MGEIPPHGAYPGITPSWGRGSFCGCTNSVHLRMKPDTKQPPGVGKLFILLGTFRNVQT